MALTPKQRKFANEYLLCLNATEAARRAGYDGTEASLAQIGHENLRKHEIASLINQTFNDNAMSAAEVLFQLSTVARGDITDVTDDNGNLDMAKAKARGKTGIIKSTKVRTITTETSDIVEGDVILHDKLRAIELLAKYHGLLVERVQVSDWHSELLAAYRQGVLSAEQIAEELGDEFAQELLIAESVPSTSS